MSLVVVFSVVSLASPMSARTLMQPSVQLAVQANVQADARTAPPPTGSATPAAPAARDVFTVDASSIHRMVRNATSREEFKAISTYYKGKGEAYRALAGAWKREMTRELERPSGSKYPTGADRARQMHEFYLLKADQTFALASSYEKRAAALSPLSNTTTRSSTSATQQP